MGKGEANEKENEEKPKKLKDSKKLGEDGSKKRKLKEASEKFEGAWQASAKEAAGGDVVLPEKSTKRLRKSKAGAASAGASTETTGATAQADAEGKSAEKKA